MVISQIKSITVVNFKCFEGRRRFGDFRNLAAIYGATGSGKSLLLEAISFGFGASAEELGCNSLREIINERANHCVVIVVVNYRNEERTFQRTISQLEDENGDLLPYSCQYEIEERESDEDEYLAILQEMNILRPNKACLVVQNARNHFRLDDPDAFANWFAVVFQLEEKKKLYESLTKRLAKAEKEKNVLQALGEALESERNLTIQFLLLKMHRAVYICNNTKMRIEKKEEEIARLEAELVAAARSHYYPERANVVANGRALLEQKKRVLQKMRNTEGLWESRWAEARDEAKLDNLQIPTRLVKEENGQELYEVVYDSLPQDRLNHASVIEPFMHETMHALNSIRQSWKVLNKIPPEEYHYLRLGERLKIYDRRVKQFEEEQATMKADLEEAKLDYTRSFVERLNELSQAMANTYRQVYNDETRSVSLTLFEGDIDQGIEGTIDTAYSTGDDFFSLSGGEKRLLELTLQCAVAQLTSTPFLFLDSFDNTFHAKTFNHVLRFLRVATERLCQIVVVCRSSDLYRQIDSRVEV